MLVTPHLYPAETFTYMKKKGWLPQKTVAIATDYTCIPFWEETDCDYYVIPHEDLVEEFASYGIPREKTSAAGNSGAAAVCPSHEQRRRAGSSAAAEGQEDLSGA